MVYIQQLLDYFQSLHTIITDNSLWILLVLLTIIILPIFFLFTHRAQSKKNHLRLIIDILYDIVICSFSLIDIACDIMVAYSFYHQKRMVFFWISIAIFAVAQISYALIITISLESLPNNNYKRHERTLRTAAVFFVTLPFGQFVPLFLMIQDAYLDKFDEFYHKIGFRCIFQEYHDKVLKDRVPLKHKSGRTRKRKKRKMSLDEEYRMQQYYDEELHDPLSDYIKRKAISHLGFIVEAVVEAVPQSILQMVFIVMYGNYTSLNIFSIVMSMTVVASKGALLCYNIYRPAAVFNFLAFSADIFGIFAVCSWLFCVSDVDTIYNIFDFPVWGPAYYYFIGLYGIGYLAIPVVGVGLTCLVYRQNKEHPWFGLFFAFLMISGAMLVSMPVVLVVLTIRFTLVPLLVLRSVDHSRHKSLAFYSKLFDFFSRATSMSDLHERILVANWRLAILAVKYSTNYLGDPYRMPAIKLVSEMKENELALDRMYSTFNWHGLSTCHQIRLVLYFLWQMSLWKLWKKGALKENEDREENVEDVYDWKVYTYTQRQKQELLMENEANYEAQSERFFALCNKFKYIIGWRDTKSEIARKWREFISIRYAHEIQLFWDNVSRELSREWRIHFYPDLKNWFTKRVPHMIQMLLSRFILAIIQDITNIYLKINRLCWYIRWWLTLVAFFTYHYIRLYVDYGLYCIGCCKDDDRYQNISLRKCRKNISILAKNSDLFIKPRCVIIPYEYLLLDWVCPWSWAFWDHRSYHPQHPFYRANHFRYDSNYATNYNNRNYYSSLHYTNGQWFPKQLLQAEMPSQQATETYGFRVNLFSGIVTYFFNIVYYLIHSPIRDVMTAYFWHNSFPFLALWIGILGVVPCLLYLAVYSLFLPMIFTVTSIFYYGLSTDLMENQHLLQMVLTICHSVILLVMVFLVPRVWKFVYSDFHLYPFFNDKTPTPVSYAQHVCNVFEMTPVLRKMLEDKYGCDIASELLKFLPKYYVYDDESHPPLDLE